LNKDIIDTLKKTALYDGIILIVSLVIALIFFRSYTIAVIAGLLVALINFLLNAVATNHLTARTGSAALVVGASIVRIALACAIALLLYQGNVKNVAAYLIGYTLHFIAVIGAGLGTGKKPD